MYVIQMLSQDLHVWRTLRLAGREVDPLNEHTASSAPTSCQHHRTISSLKATCVPADPRALTSLCPPKPIVRSKLRLLRNMRHLLPVSPLHLQERIQAKHALAVKGDELGVGHHRARRRHMLPPRLEAVNERLRLCQDLRTSHQLHTPACAP